MQLDQNRQTSIREAIKLCQEDLWSPQGADVLENLISRGYSNDEIRCMGVGAFPGIDKCRAVTGDDWEWIENKLEFRLTVPYINLDGYCLGLFGRLLTPPNPELKENEFKYEALTVMHQSDKNKNTLCCLHPPEYGSHLFMVEGLFDALIASVRGIDNLIGAGGPDLFDRSEVAIVSRGHKSVTYVPDNDAMGAKGAEIIERKLTAAGIKVVIRHLPVTYKDPDRFIVSEGIDAFRELIMSEASEN